MSASMIVMTTRRCLRPASPPAPCYPNLKVLYTKLRKRERDSISGRTRADNPHRVRLYSFEPRAHFHRLAPGTFDLEVSRKARRSASLHVPMPHFHELCPVRVMWITIRLLADRSGKFTTETPRPPRQSQYVAGDGVFARKNQTVTSGLLGVVV
jgi:hypothetical protein